ncbi:PucR family transcriptional regulator [Terrarubrum flagellatum]|uniref:PucR family transcriptional regulator n=1 Tax=Terrirubrum flagellatum TaxID=2895980 RepID=UPI0031452203
MPAASTKGRRSSTEQAAKTRSGVAGISDFGMTVEECLRIAPLDEAKVVAGSAGLSRRMSWVHVVDHRDMEDSLDSHELLLTSGIALANDEALQREIFEIMDRRHSAGLVIAIGDYIQEIPKGMRELADIFEIPLIAIPWKVNFGDITRVLLTQFVESQYRFMELSQKLNHELLAVVLQKGDLHALCACIANVAGAPVAICNENFKPVAASRVAPSEPTFDEKTLRAGLAVTTFSRSGRVASQLVGASGEAIGVATPIFIAERRRGYLVMEAGAMSPGVAGRLAEAAATVAALVISHEDELLRVARRADGQLIGLLTGALPPSVGALVEIGLRGADPLTVLIATIDSGDLQTALELTAEFLRRRAGACALAIRDRSIIGLVQKPSDRASNWSSTLVEHLREHGVSPLLGVSGVIANPNDIPARYEDVKELMRLRYYLQPEGAVVHADHATVLLRALRSLISSANLEEICPAIIKLKEHDRSLHGSLVEALGCLLEVDWNVSLAARRLGIHRHTILYRLERISEILDTELTATMRFELRLQLLAWRIAGQD